LQVNIILVAGANARARTITLDWRHWAAGGSALLIVFLAFTFAFNFVTLKWAAAMQHPWLSAIVLADQREEAARVQERVQGHMQAMAMRLGELQAQMLRLENIGNRLARTAGLSPQELPTAPGRGGAASTSFPARNLTADELGGHLRKLAGEMDLRADQFSVLEALVVHNTANRKFLPTLYPVLEGWHSSNFGYRIDPFTGQQSMHEGIDFPAEPGTPVVAAASGKVISAESHPAYGKMVEIDHGNGLVSRYAHTSMVFVKQGDLVMRGQRVAAVGSTGRSTGPHLHFEVRLNGVPQNPARFLTASSLD
jgi:murein DD-endopeptidase MepM/ murein hydrolase activator NlpD